MTPSVALQSESATLYHPPSHSGGDWVLDSPCNSLAWGSHWWSPTCTHSQWRMTFTVLHELAPAYCSRLFSCCSSRYSFLSSKACDSTPVHWLIEYMLDECVLCVAVPLFISSSPSGRSSFYLPCNPLSRHRPGSLPCIVLPCSGVALPALCTYHHTCNVWWWLFTGPSRAGMWAPLG